MKKCSLAEAAVPYYSIRGPCLDGHIHSLEQTLILSLYFITNLSFRWC